MSFKEVKELRKSGKLSEALIMAQQDFENDSSNIWSMRSLGWVYYDYLKIHAAIEEYPVFKEYLAKLKALDLPSEEQMIFDSCSYQIGKMVFSIVGSEPFDYRKMDEIFGLIRGFHFSKPSESYTFLLKAFHKSYKNWANYLDFADWWGFDNNLRPEDYLEVEFNGNKTMSLAEQVYIAYSKKLEIPATSNDANSNQLSIGSKKIELFLPQLDALIESHPEYQYPPYFKAKLLLALGNKENVLSAFIPFAQKKRKDFWVWELMSEVFPAVDARRFACLCKALSLRTPEDFLINIRLKLTELLVEQTKYAEAKNEIEKIISVRNEHQWKIPSKIENWTKSAWFAQTTATKSNFSFYKQFTHIAEEILYANVVEELVVVEYVNESKSMISFVKDRTKSGFFYFRGLIDKPLIGDTYMVRFAGDSKDNFYKIVSARKIIEPVDCPAILRFSGRVKKSGTSDFCFVDNVFIGPEFSDKDSLCQNETVIGIAILSFNKKKNEWGWKAITVSKI